MSRRSFHCAAAAFAGALLAVNLSGAAPKPAAIVAAGHCDSRFITEVRGRRFPVVDQDYGLVLAFGSFDHSGRIKTVKLADGSTLKVPPPFDAPYSFLMAELFKIQRGRIARIEAVIVTTPYTMPSGW